MRGRWSPPRWNHSPGGSSLYSDRIYRYYSAISLYYYSTIALLYTVLYNYIAIVLQQYSYIALYTIVLQYYSNIVIQHYSNGKCGQNKEKSPLESGSILEDSIGPSSSTSTCTKPLLRPTFSLKSVVGKTRQYLYYLRPDNI